MNARHKVCLIHAFDPRGAKVGGIETYTRDFITFCPDDIDLLMIGVDGFGDLPVGKITELEFRGRRFKFMPVLRWDDAKTNVYAKGFRSSLTFLFCAALFKFWPMLRKKLRREGYCVEIHRSELVPFVSTLGVPWVSFLHTDATRENAMSSLLKKYWFVKEWTEGFDLARCSRFFCVNPLHTERLRAQNPRHADKIDTLSTWANPNIFKPTPFAGLDGPLKVVYAGRMDRFKRPEKMFAVIDQLAKRCDTPVEFHYIGDGDVETFPQFDAIRHLTTQHGRKPASEVADIVAKAHIGIMTSDLEGMPRFAIETVALGRPVCSLHLPQLEALITDGESGTLVDRDDAREVTELADRIGGFWTRIRNGEVIPQGVARAAEAYRPETILQKIYNVLRGLAPVRA